MRGCIQDFIKSWKNFDGKEPIVWYIRFRDAGYYSVAVPNLSQWTQVHAWCEEQFGQEHYACAGSTFYFETEQAAIQFTLRWS